MKKCPRCGGSGVVPDRRRKLTDEQIAEARRLKANGVQQQVIARYLGVDPATISRLVGRRRSVP